MSTALQKPWTQEAFFAWAERQDIRYEFDGLHPVAMTGGTIGHGRVMRNLHRALDTRLRGSPCEPLGPDVGIETLNKAVRYPDALVTCAKVAENAARLVPGVVVVFEVVSPHSSRVDRIIKVREYAAISTLRRYVILESSSIGLTVFERDDGGDPWRAATLDHDDHLHMPEIGIEIPVREIYADIVFDDPALARDD
jgi:Uma2 family endonuclease